MLSALAQRAKAHWGYPPEWLEAWRPALTISAAYLIEHTVLIVERAGDMLGFAAVRDAGTHWELEHLWVEPDFQGQGVGRALFSAVACRAARRRPGRLRIESDPFAAGFYERCGARRVGMIAAPVLGEARELPVYEYALQPRVESRPGPANQLEE